MYDKKPEVKDCVLERYANLCVKFIKETQPKWFERDIDKVIMHLREQFDYHWNLRRSEWDTIAKKLVVPLKEVGKEMALLPESYISDGITYKYNAITDKYEAEGK